VYYLPVVVLAGCGGLAALPLFLGQENLNQTDIHQFYE